MPGSVLEMKTQARDRRGHGVVLMADADEFDP
jgi:hypothetical protein